MTDQEVKEFLESFNIAVAFLASILSTAFSPTIFVSMPSGFLFISNDVGAVLQRAEQVRGGEGVVDDHRQMMLVGDCGDGLEMLVPFVKESVGEINLPDRTLTMEKTDGEIAEDNLDWEKEADMDAALDFADSF